MTLRFQTILASTLILASLGVGVAALTATTAPAGASKGDRLDWTPVAEQPASIDVATPAPGLTVIARQP